MGNYGYCCIAQRENSAQYVDLRKIWILAFFDDLQVFSSVKAY